MMFIVLGIILFVAGIGIGANMEPSNKGQELYTGQDILKTLISDTNTQDVEGQVSLKGAAGLKFMGTFVVVQVDKDTPLTLIDEIVDVENWKCSNGVCSGTVTFHTSKEEKREQFAPSVRESNQFQPLRWKKQTVYYGRNLTNERSFPSNVKQQ